MKLTKLVLRIVCLLVFAFTLSAQRSFTTGGGEVVIYQNSNDAGVYYNVPSNEVAYNVQIVKINSTKYVTVYHGEPNKSTTASFGDSVKIGVRNDSNWWLMPTVKNFKIWSHPTDIWSILFSSEGTNIDSVSGGGNPMVTLYGGQYHILFLGVTHDSHPQRLNDSGWRHYLLQARTTDFVNMELRTQLNSVMTWKPFNETVDQTWRRPLAHTATDNLGVVSIKPRTYLGTYGLIGSIVKYSDKYYYFYTDMDNTNKTWLYYRTATDLTIEKCWSPAQKVTTSLPLQNDCIVRVAKTYCPYYKKWRWAVFYSCYRISGSSYKQDIAVEYTKNMILNGSGGLNSLKFHKSIVNGLGLSDYYLNLNQSVNGCYQQHYYMSDAEGTLVVPSAYGQGDGYNGIITWTDFLPDNAYGGTVWRAGYEVFKKTI